MIKKMYPLLIQLNMKINDFKIKLFAFMAMFLGTFITGCNKNESISETKIETDYSELSLLIRNSLEDIGQNLRNQNTTFKSQNDVIWAAEQYFADDLKEYDAFSVAYNKAVNNSNLKSVVNDEVVNTVIGTVSAGVVGAIGGAIAGGLKGAAASC